MMIRPYPKFFLLLEDEDIKRLCEDFEQMHLEESHNLHALWELRNHIQDYIRERVERDNER